MIFVRYIHRERERDRERERERERESESERERGIEGARGRDRERERVREREREPNPIASVLFAFAFSLALAVLPFTLRCSFRCGGLRHARSFRLQHFGDRGSLGFVVAGSHGGTRTIANSIDVGT